MGAARSSRCRTCSERVLDARVIEALQAERTIEALGRLENLQELVGVARVHETADDLALRRSCRASRSSPTRTRSRKSRPRDAHDAPQREGARVSRGVHQRAWRRGVFPALRARSRSRASRRSAASSTSACPRQRAVDAPARLRAVALGSRVQPAEPLLDELGAATERERLRRRRGRRPAPWRRRPPRARTASRPVTPFATRPSARASSSGSSREGVVTVRFEDDGSERRLWLEYAARRLIDAERPRDGMPSGGQVGPFGRPSPRPSRSSSATTSSISHAKIMDPSRDLPALRGWDDARHGLLVSRSP